MRVFKSKNPEYIYILEKIKDLISIGTPLSISSEDLEYMVSYMTLLDDKAKQKFLSDAIVNADLEISSMRKHSGIDDLYKLPIFFGIVNMVDNFFDIVGNLSSKEVTLLSCCNYNVPNEVIKRDISFYCNSEILPAIIKKANGKLKNEIEIFDCINYKVFTSDEQTVPAMSMDEIFNYINNFTEDEVRKYKEALEEYERNHPETAIKW